MPFTGVLMEVIAECYFKEELISDPSLFYSLIEEFISDPSLFYPLICDWESLFYVLILL